MKKELEKVYEEVIWLKKQVPKGVSPVGFLLRASKPFYIPMTIALMAVFVASVMDSVAPYIFKKIVDGAVEASGAVLESITLWVVVYMVLFSGSMLIWRVSGFAGMRWSTGVRATAREILTRYVMQHSHEYFSNRFAGAISSKITAAANGARSLVGMTLWSLLGFFVTMVTSFVIAYIAHPYFAGIFFAYLICLICINTFFAKKRVGYSEAAEKAETRLVGETVDMLTNVTAMHEYARTPFELKKLRKSIIERRIHGLRNWRFGEKTLLLNSVLQSLFTAVLLGVALFLAHKNIITVGDVVLIVTMTFLVLDRITFIGNLLMDISETWGSMKEGLQDILVAHEVTEQKEAGALQAPSGEIQLDHVTFQYGSTTVFDDFSLLIPAGQRVGLVGRSGAGKTTLIKILLRHFDIQSGVITIDGKNISEVTKESLRESIALVPQEPMLFHRSIHENIAYGKTDATTEEVTTAAKHAEAHDFIETLEEGYDSKVGERGVKLSGGQRQRIAIARALLKDAPILILDEATSALDSESEVAVQKALLTLMENRTVIAIAHRLSTLRAMDRIIVLDEGKITESGTHEELIEQNGVYASLWEHQAGGFLEEDE